MWRQYRDEKRTLKQLTQQHQCSLKTIQRRLAQAKKKHNHFIIHEKVNVVLDTTYFQRTFGVMLLVDSLSGQTLSVNIVHHETNQLYLDELQKLIDKGTVIQSIICDGRRGMTQLLDNTPVQLYQL